MSLWTGSNTYEPLSFEHFEFFLVLLHLEALPLFEHL